MITIENGFEAVSRLADLTTRARSQGRETEACLLAAAAKMIELWLTDGDDAKLRLANELTAVVAQEVEATTVNNLRDPEGH